MRIAIVGTGIAGNVAAYRLAAEHEIVVYEAEDRIGGHSNTVEVSHEGRSYAVDTGFIVFNDRTYPNFNALLDEIGVRWRATEMSFSVRDRQTGFEYNGSTYNSLFAQRSNLLRPAFYRMIRDILRFNRQACEVLERGPEVSLEALLTGQRYSREFVERYIVPMGAAIWSAPPETIKRMPARFFVRFFENHGLLTIDDRPTWRVIEGGSREYVRRLVAGHRDRIRLGTPVESIRRSPGRVDIKAKGCESEAFDAVFLACHSDQALALLVEPTRQEREILGAIAYRANDVILHTDASLMPQRRLAWAAWNYHLLGRAHGEGVAVTYNMNILQGLVAPIQFCVTVNDRDAVDRAKILARFSYRHPMFSPDAVAAQQRHAEISGQRGTYYCGAYWRYGFHEDGVRSALTALEQFNDRIAHEQRHLRRAG